MREADRGIGSSSEHDPFWSVDTVVGEVLLGDQPQTVRVRAHFAEEQYHRTSAQDELPALSIDAGTRVYMLAQPYVLVPDVTLTVGLYPTPRGDGAIGEVIDAKASGARRLPIGAAQAWYYPQDRVAMLWECLLNEPYRHLDPTDDPTHCFVWVAIEQLLVETFPSLDRLITPSWEPLYETRTWQEFLGGRGYSRLADAAYAKKVGK